MSQYYWSACPTDLYNKSNLYNKSEPQTHEFTCDVIILVHKYALDDITHERVLHDLRKFSTIWSEFVWRLFESRSTITGIIILSLKFCITYCLASSFPSRV